MRIALDGMALRREGRGVARVLQQLLPLLAADPRLDCVILSTREGREMLGPGGSLHLDEVRHMHQSVWEQFGLPWHARRVKADAIYSHAECAPLWGPPLLLHVPEDPFVRWHYTRADSLHEVARRTYQRTAVPRGLRHACVMATSSSACKTALTERFDFKPVLDRQFAVIPLGVNTEFFHPDSEGIRDHGIFHLSSAEARDLSTVVVRAYSRALSLAPDLPDLYIAGDLGSQRKAVIGVARASKVDHRIHLLGRISDDQLRERYAGAALCVQPSLYEGFGLQPLEALACGAPLIVFPEPSVEEVVGDAAVIANDRDETSLANCIARLWADTELRSALQEDGPRRAAVFSWTRTATLVADILVEMVGHRRVNGAR